MISGYMRQDLIIHWISSGKNDVAWEPVQHKHTYWREIPHALSFESVQDSGLH
jgi:hypothetical protein